MANWYKKAWNHGLTRVDELEEYGDRPLSTDHRHEKETEKDLTRPAWEFGGNEREGYPKGISSREDDSDYGKLRGKLPGEGVLMDGDPAPGEGVGGQDETFTSQGEGQFGGGSDNDKMPPNSISKQLDNTDVGPHNMWTRGVFRKIKNKSRIRGLNTI